MLKRTNVGFPAQRSNETAIGIRSEEVIPVATFTPLPSDGSSYRRSVRGQNGL
jgi:hypothetical protein